MKGNKITGWMLRDRDGDWLEYTFAQTENLSWAALQDCLEREGEKPTVFGIDYDWIAKMKDEDQYYITRVNVTAAER